MQRITSLRIPVSLTLGLFPPLVICLWLGQWQLERMAEKQALFQQFENAEKMDLSQAISEKVRYARVRVRGTYDPQAIILLDNKILDGRAGVHVLQLFHPETGSPILVNRGWLPMTADRSNLPEVATPVGHSTIEGVLSAPVKDGFKLGEPDRLSRLDRPQLITYLDLDAVSAALGEPLTPWLILLDSRDTSGFSGRDWRPSVMLPAQHGAYAAQWFGLAIAIAVTWVALVWRASRKSRFDGDAQGGTTGVNE